MAPTERLLFGFSYHRVGQTDLWKPGGSTLGRLSAGHPPQEPGVRLAQHGYQIVWIDVVVDREASQDLDALSLACETRADAEFLRLYPGAQLLGVEESGG